MWLGSPDHFLLRGARCWAQVLPRRSFSNQGFCIVSSPDSTLSCGKGSSDHWVLFFGCAESAVSSQSSIVRRHNYVFTLTNQIGLSWIPNICLFRNQYCWLNTLKKNTQRSPDPFPCEKVGSGLRERPGSERVGPGHETSVCIICHFVWKSSNKQFQFMREKRYHMLPHIFWYSIIVFWCNVIIFDQFDMMWRNSSSAVSILSQGSLTLVWCFWHLDHFNTSTQRTDSKDVYTYQP